MCYEFWRSEQMKADEQEERKRAKEALDRAKARKPIAPQTVEPVTAETEAETVAA
jgi:hypothetical protein